MLWIYGGRRLGATGLAVTAGPRCPSMMRAKVPAAGGQVLPDLTHTVCGVSGNCLEPIRPREDGDPAAAAGAIAISGGRQACSPRWPELYDREFRDYLVTGGRNGRTGEDDRCRNGRSHV